MTNVLALTMILALSGVPQDDPKPVAPQDAQSQPSDRAVNPAQPDFTLIGLPTTLKMPRFASAFRVTHRFNRDLGRGSFGDLVEDFFGFDAGGQIGLEYRFGIMSGTQVGIHRTSDRTIQFFLQHRLVGQGNSPVGIDALATIEGIDNFRDEYSPALGVVISRELGSHGALYVAPIWVNNTNILPVQLVTDEDDDTVIIGVGGRFRIRPTVYVVAEAAPRFLYGEDDVYGSFGVEKRAGGHSFQVNIGNGLGTTIAQMARGSAGKRRWYIGFNITRKFF